MGLRFYISVFIFSRKGKLYNCVEFKGVELIENYYTHCQNNGLSMSYETNTTFKSASIYSIYVQSVKKPHMYVMAEE